MHTRWIHFLAGALVFSVCAIAGAKIPGKGLTSCAAFSSTTEIEQLLIAYETAHPDLAQALTIGHSVEGRPIWALVISQSPQLAEAEPLFRIVGGIHGNECLSVEITLRIAEWLITDYGTDPWVTELLDGAALVLVPLVNPDGYQAEPASRYNAHNVDLNGNFGFAWLDEGVRPFSEPETIALRELGRDRSFVLGLSYHTVADFVNSPWNYTPHHPLDEALIDALGQAYAGSSGYNVTFGWDWYGINGDLNDWSLGTGGVFDWTIELRSDTEMEWLVHQSGLIEFLNLGLCGVSGTVTDAEGGQPLAARIQVEPAGEPIFTSPDLGRFQRVLLPGTYALTAVANGYEPFTVSDLEVVDNGLVTADFPLVKGGDYYAFAVSQMTLPQAIGPEYQVVEYENSTRPADALGSPDGAYYSLSPGGSITVDMGPTVGVGDLSGPDLVVLSGTGSADPAQVLVAAFEDGPFRPAGQGSGDIDAEVPDSGPSVVRFVRVVDLGDGPFNGPAPGYDLDAVLNLAPIPAGDLDSDSDVDDGGLDQDGGKQPVMVGGCGCTSIGRVPSGSWFPF